MAYINVAEWSPDQVADWIKGLDDSMYNYVYSFINNGVGGHQLLNIRPYELEQLGMNSIGHQEIVLEAVENLRNFHYNLDKENLQFMALHVATAARSLHRQLATRSGDSVIGTCHLNDITRTISTIKPLIGWLDRSPFLGQFQYTEVCRKMLRLGLEMATIAQRERFVENPVEQISSTAKTLERLANYIIQDITDPMLLQPASLNLVTLKKRESELGFNIETSYHGVHRVIDIKHNSPAHNSGKIEDGDEIVQINYQTIVGWQYKTVLAQLRESLPDVLLTLKKRPKHTKIYGQIYMQPYRLPSKKRNGGTRWGENVSSPRPTFLKVPESSFKIPLISTVENDKNDDVDTDSICSDILTPTDTKVMEKENRLYYPKPRAMLQRRNTVCGDELLRHKILTTAPHWLESRAGNTGDPSSPSLRDKSVSFGFGLEIAVRPTTCIGGIGSGVNEKFTNDRKNHNKDTNKLRHLTDSTRKESCDISKSGVSKVVRFNSSMKADDYPLDEKYTCNIQNTILETFEPIPFVDEEEDSQSKFMPSREKAAAANEATDSPIVEAVNISVVTRRGRLDKSHSTPAYDNSADDADIPPAIEPRKEFRLITPPAPPPRPRKPTDSATKLVPIPPPKSSAFATISSSQCPIDTPTRRTPMTDACIVNESEAQDKTFVVLLPKSEAHSQTKSKGLTLKKKQSLFAKRRNVNLKILGTGDIQGYLYRRTKDKRGVTFWARLYFVMLNTILYGFRVKEATKANCVIYLPGFTVALAKEVHSKTYAFKVYNTSKTFYFAAESQDALLQWVDLIRQATLTSSDPISASSTVQIIANSHDLYSENDSSSEEIDDAAAKPASNSALPNNKDNAQITSQVNSQANTSTSSKGDRRYLGSLRKLTKGSLPFKGSSGADKKLSDIPVPTDQFRSYRKVPGGSFGIQIGANTPGYYDSTMHPLNSARVNTAADQSEFLEKLSNIPPMSPTQGSHKKQADLSNEQSCFSVNSNDFLKCTLMPEAVFPSAPNREAVPPTTEQQSSEVHISCDISTNNSPRVETPSNNVKKIPYNFIHASNPNLVEFDFQTSRTLDYTLPKVNSTNAWDTVQNMQGFVTLRDLMLQKQEEEAQEMYNNRVFLGVEKKEEMRKNITQKAASASKQPSDASLGSEDPKVFKTQSRSLPKPPDYEISFKPDDEDIQLTRTKEGLKLRDFGYELISGDEPLNTSSRTMTMYNSPVRQQSPLTTAAESHDLSSPVGNNWPFAMRSRPFLLPAHKNKKPSPSNSCTSVDFKNSAISERRLGSFKKKGKLESFKTSSEKLFQFNKHSAPTGGATGLTMTLPLNKNSQSVNDSPFSKGGIKKSQTYNKDLKEKASKYDAQRKNSAPMPILSKLSFPSSSSVSCSSVKTNARRDKKNVNSPPLHRTNIAGLSSINACTGRDYDPEIFAPVIFPKKRVNAMENSVTLSAPDTVAPPPPISQNANAGDQCLSSSLNSTITEYPNLECPPVFEPDIYSLSDPNVSVMLRRSNNNNTSTNNSAPAAQEYCNE